MDNFLAVWTTVLHVFTGINAEGNAAAEEASKYSQSPTDEPGHESRGVLRAGGHSLLAVRAHSLSRDIM